jgi:OmpA-OmpF porin, OOP family
MTLLSFGLQLKLDFRTSGAKRAARQPAKVEPAPPQATTFMSDRDTAVVLFGALGETDILGIQQVHLSEIAAILKQHPEVRISIIGHICNSGTATEDVSVGETRAKAVADYLRQKGVDRSRMDVSWLSESDPVLPNNPPANYQNRKVVIKVL